MACGLVQFPRMRKTQDTQERILRAAIHEFAYHGFNRGIVHIARKARVNEITIYRLFNDKDGLCRAALRDASRSNTLVTHLTSILAQDTLPCLSETIAELVRLTLGPTRDYYRLLYQAALARPDLLKEWDEDKLRPHTHPLLTEYIRRLQAQGDLVPESPPEQASRDIFGILLGAFSRNVLTPGGELSDPDPVEAVRHFFQILERRAVDRMNG